MFIATWSGIGKHVNMSEIDTEQELDISSFIVYILVSQTSRHLNRYDNHFVAIRVTEKECERYYLYEPDRTHKGQVIYNEPVWVC